MNLISGTHHSCERREYAFMVLPEYTIIFRATGHTYVRAIWGFRVRQIFNLGKMICYACERDFVFNLLGKGSFCL